MAIHRDILRLAIPSILANITIPLVGLVDTAIVGHISDAAAIGGIAVGAMLFDLLYWPFGFLRVGTSGLTARAYASRQTGPILLQSLSIALGGAALIWLLQWFFVEGVLALMPCSEPVSHFARQYFYIRIWAAPATLSLMAMKGWFIGMQDTVSPMITDMVVNGANMLASYMLAVHTPLGPIGVAWGTLLAQYAGLLVGGCLIIGRYRQYLSGFEWRHIWRNHKDMQHVLTLNANLFIRSVCMLIIYVGYTTFASRYGDTELAVSAILMRLFMLFSYFADGFAYAGEALVGRHMGEHNGWLTRQTVGALTLWALLIGGLCTIAYGLWGEEAIRLLTTDTCVIEAARPYLLWLTFFPLVSTLAFSWDGIFIGATAGPQARNAMVYSATAFIIFFGCSFTMGPQALYIAYFAHLLTRVIYLTAEWKRSIAPVL